MFFIFSLLISLRRFSDGAVRPGWVMAGAGGGGGGCYSSEVRVDTHTRAQHKQVLSRAETHSLLLSPASTRIRSPSTCRHTLLPPRNGVSRRRLAASHSHTRTHTHTHTHTYTHARTHADRQTDRETDRQTEVYIKRV